MSFCTGLPNFVQIGRSATELRRHIHFLRWRPRRRNSASGLVFRNFAHLGRSKSTRRPNFGEISQSTAEMILLPVSKNKRSPCWNSTSVSIFTFASLSACYSASAHQISSKSDYTRWSYDVLAIFKWRPSAILNFLEANCRPPTKCKWWSQEGPQISSTSDLCFRKYCYFYVERF